MANWSDLAKGFTKSAGKNALKAVAWAIGGIFCIQKATARAWDGGADEACSKWCEATEKASEKVANDTESND